MTESSPPHGPYLATCAGGFEGVLKKELAGAPFLARHVCTYAGSVVFETATKPEDLKLLRSADNIYAFLLHRQPIPLDKEPGLEFLESAAKEVDWICALTTFRQWNPKASRIVDGSVAGVPSFRVTCERRSIKLRKHAYSSMDAAGYLGFGIKELLGWRADMTHFDVEVIATIWDDELLLALSLIYSPRETPGKDLPLSNDPRGASGEFDSQKRREPLQAKAHHQSRQLYFNRPYRKFLVRTSLKPSTAFALCQLADIQPGHVVLDPLCGCGTIPLEAADYYGSAIGAFGGEINEEAVAKAGQNLQAGQQGGRPGACDVIRWNATQLPWRDQTVDRVVSDMPFGVLCGSAKERNNLFPSVLKELARVLVLGTGRAVLLCQGRKVRNDLEQPALRAYFVLEKSFPINMEGILVDLYVLRRTETAVLMTPPATRSRKRDRPRRMKSGPPCTVTIVPGLPN